MPQYALILGFQRHAEITLDARLPLCVLLLQATRVETQTPVDHFLARGTGKIVLDVGNPFAARPEGNCANPPVGGKFGDERVMGRGCLGDMSYQQLEEARSGDARCTFRYEQQRGKQFVSVVTGSVWHVAMKYILVRHLILSSRARCRFTKSSATVYGHGTGVPICWWVDTLPARQSPRSSSPA